MFLEKKINELIKVIDELMKYREIYVDNPFHVPELILEISRKGDFWFKVEVPTNLMRVWRVGVDELCGEAEIVLQKESVLILCNGLPFISIPLSEKVSLPSLILVLTFLKLNSNFINKILHYLTTKLSKYKFMKDFCEKVKAVTTIVGA